jgi:hypothetical protein
MHFNHNRLQKFSNPLSLIICLDDLRLIQGLLDQYSGQF